MVSWYNKSTHFERNSDFASLHLYIVLYSNLEILPPTHHFTYVYIIDFVSIMCMIILFIQHSFLDFIHKYIQRTVERARHNVIH